MIKKEKIKDLHYVLTGEISADELTAAADKILAEHGKTAKIAGFRPGHIPLNILRTRFGDAANAQATDEIITADVDKFVADKKIRLAARPTVDMKDGEYIVEFDILPTLPEIDLSKFSVTKKVATVSDAEVDKALDNLRKSRAQFEKMPDDYAAADGDAAIIDFKGFLGKEAFEGGEAKKHRLVIGSNSFIPGFEEKLIGHKTGEKFDIKVKFPSDYHAENLAGRDAKFEIEIHELRRPQLPELNDELAKSVGQENVTALKNHIKEMLAAQYAEVAQKAMRDELLESLGEKVKLDLPESLVAQELDITHQECKRTNTPFDEKKERTNAQHRVKLGLILAEWGNANKVVVSREDLQQAIWAEAARYPEPQQIFDFYNKNQNALAMMRGMLFEQKAVDAMLANVKIKEKTVKPDDLWKQ